MTRSLVRSLLRATTLLLALAAPLAAQPSFSGPLPSTTPVSDPAARRAAYLARAHEAITWVAGDTKYRTDDPANFDLAEVIAKMLLNQDLEVARAASSS